MGATLGVIKGDTRSLDYGSCMLVWLSSLGLLMFGRSQVPGYPG